MTKHTLQADMTFLLGRAAFFAKAREGVIYPLGSQKVHVIDGQVVGGGGTTAYFKEHRWSTDVPEYAAGMVTQPHFMDIEGYVLDPSCLPSECLKVWPALDRKGKQQLCLSLINGDDPSEAAVSVAEHVVPVEPPVEEPARESFACPVGCGVSVDGETDPIKARTAILTHVRLVHPNWEG
jgi:hypothetical protein